MKDKELKITESAVRAAMETCATAREVLSKLFEDQLTGTPSPGKLYQTNTGRKYLCVCLSGDKLAMANIETGYVDYSNHRYFSLLPGKLTVEEDIPF